MDAIRTLLKQMQDFWAARDKAFKRIFIVSLSVVLVAIVAAGILLNHTTYAVLFADLADADAGQVMSVLEEQNVDAKVQGNAILVPASEVDKLRMELASEGYPKNNFSLDILSQGQGLTSTESDKEDYRKYQLQYNLQNMIKQFSGVADAQVMLTIPQQSSLVIQSNKQDATAAILLTLKDGVEGISQDNINAIYSFVQRSVPGLTPQNISIVDSNMNVLSLPDEQDGTAAVDDHMALQKSTQDKLQQQVMALLMPIFGMGKVQAQVAVTLDFDKHTTDSEKFEPSVNNKDGVIVSIDKLRESIVNGDVGNVETGTDTNTGTAEYPVVNTDNGTYEKNTEKINYEINTIKDHLEAAQGTVKNLTVSVAIDNTGAADDYTDIVTDLVAGTVGTDKSNVTVRYIPMSGTTSLTDAMKSQQDAAASAAKSALIRNYVILGVVAALILIAMLLIYRLLHPKPIAVPAEAGAMEGTEFLDGMEVDREADELGVLKDSETRAQLGKFIETNPELAANLLRSWLSEED